MTPIYLPDNCSAAYQLNWSVAVFGRIDFPAVEGWIEPLQRATEADGVRILEYQVTSPNVAQFLVSTRPDVSPSEIMRSVKGRWQYVLRNHHPSAFRRNYFLGGMKFVMRSWLIRATWLCVPPLPKVGGWRALGC